MKIKLKIHENEEIEKLARKQVLERNNISDQYQIQLGKMKDPTTSELENLASQLDLDLGELDRLHAEQKDQLLLTLADSHLNKMNKLKASSKSHSGLVVDDKNVIYSELEALARQQEQLLKEMEDYEDFEEPNNEDLANRLKNLKFEVKGTFITQHNFDLCIPLSGPILFF